MDRGAILTDADIEDAAVVASQKEQQPPADADEMMVDDIVQQEELELEALLESFHQPSITQTSFINGAAINLPQRPPSPYFSDDDEFDQALMELVQNEAHNNDVEMW